MNLELLVKLQIGCGDARGHESHGDATPCLLDPAEKSVAFLLGQVDGDENRLRGAPSEGLENGILSLDRFDANAERREKKREPFAERRVLVDDQYEPVGHRFHGRFRLFGTPNRIADGRGRVEG